VANTSSRRTASSVPRYNQTRQPRRRELNAPPNRQTASRSEGPVRDDQITREHLRDLGADLRYWYNSAETKAQLVLTVNGLFTTFLTSSILGSPSTVAQTTGAFGPETWALLAAMATCQVLAILSAVTCLRSRGLSRRKLEQQLAQHGVDPDRPSTYAPELSAFFFFYITALKPRHFTAWISDADREFTTRALASEIVDFSPYVLAKHRWINRAFLLTGLTLALFLATGASYLIRAHLGATTSHG
jgi:hypothetical protein